MTRVRHTLYIIITALTMLLSLSSCDGNVIFYTFCHTPIEGWEKNDTLTFDVPRMQSSGRYRLEVGMRTDSAFPFTGMSIIVEQTVIPGYKTYVDTLKCRFADEKGNILGRGISNYQYEFILSDLNLHRGDSLHVTVRHVMKREILPGVSDVGLKIRKK